MNHVALEEGPSALFPYNSKKSWHWESPPNVIHRSLILANQALDQADRKPRGMDAHE
jgi:hypothetical protein